MLRAIPLVCTLLVLLPLATGCSSPSAAPGSQAASTPTAAPATVLPAVTAPAAGLTPTASSPLTNTLPVVTVPVTATVPATSTVLAGTPTPSGPRPTPTGPAPSDPKDLLNVYAVVPFGNVVAKRDFLPLDGGPVDNVLLTMTSDRYDISLPITQDSASGLSILTYDPVYREWNTTWASDPISGTARPLPAANQPGGTNGGDLLRDGSHILELRTTTVDGRAHLELLRYDNKTHQATILKMVPQAGAAEKDAVFDADLDVTVADLDDDGVYEVVADNVAGVNTWRWDGSKYVPREAR